MTLNDIIERPNETTIECDIFYIESTLYSGYFGLIKKAHVNIRWLYAIIKLVSQRAQATFMQRIANAGASKIKLTKIMGWHEME